MFKLFIAFFALSLIGCLPVPCQARDNEAASKVRAYLASRAAVWSGKVEVTEKLWRPDLTTNGKYESAFDVSLGTYYCRFEDSLGHASVVDDGVFRYLASSSIFDQAGAEPEGKDGYRPPVQRLPGDQSRDDKPTPVRKQSSNSSLDTRQRAKVVDWRTVGLVSYAAWNRRRTLEEAEEILLSPEMAVSHYTSATDGAEVLTWSRPLKDGKGFWVRRAWTDRVRDFVPTKIIEGITTSEVQDTIDLDITIDSTSAFDWVKVNDVWVPGSWKYTRFNGEIGGEFSFVWMSVNQGVDEIEFGVELLAVPDGSPVVNEVTDVAFVEEIVGAAPAVVAMEERVGNINWLIVINLLLLLFGACWWWVGRRRQS